MFSLYIPGCVPTVKLHFQAPDCRHASVHSVCLGLCTHGKKICQQER